MVKASRHKPKAYPDMSLYQEIIFLQNFARCPWVIENVIPYYKPLISPTAQIGRHLYWSNFDIPGFEEPKAPANFINLCNLAGKKILMDWLDIHYEENIYHNGSHCPAQILRNCVHPTVGLHILNAAKNIHENL
jgi:DNA (cytosine-5)-methyltransferase 1